MAYQNFGDSALDGVQRWDGGGCRIEERERFVDVLELIEEGISNRAKRPGLGRHGELDSTAPTRRVPL